MNDLEQKIKELQKEITIIKNELNKHRALNECLVAENRKLIESAKYVRLH